MIEGQLDLRLDFHPARPSHLNKRHLSTVPRAQVRIFQKRGADWSSARSAWWVSREACRAGGMHLVDGRSLPQRL